MKLIGKAIGILTDINTGEKTVAFDETNHIQDRLLRGRSAYWDGGSSLGNSIMINWGANPVTQRRDWFLQPTQKAVGTNISGITSPIYTWYEPVDSVHVKELAQRFDAPASVDRNIYVIGIYSNSNYMDAAVTLTVPCVQTTSQTLDVFYRIQIAYDETYWDTEPDPESIVANPAELEAWGRWLFAYANIPIDGAAQGANWADKMNPRWLKSTIGITSNTISLISAGLASGSEYFRAGEKWNLPIANSIGKFIGVNYYKSPSSEIPMHGQHILKDTANPTPIQNVFGHSSVATVPFYDAGTTQGGLGTMVINGDLWTNPDFPKQIKLNVTGTGALTVGTYQFQMRNVLGFNQNTYENMPQECMGYHYDNRHYTDGFTIPRGNNAVTTTTGESRKTATVEKYDEQTIMAAWVDEVMVSNVTTQRGTRFAADTVPSMSLTNVSQIAKNPATGDVYVADRTNGAYKISADLTTVTRFYTATTGLAGVTGCYGINVTNAGRVWAFFDGGAMVYGLYYSDDDGASWTQGTLSHTEIDADPSLVTQLIVDPAHADDQLALVYAGPLVTPKRDLLVAWWDLAGTVAVAGAAVQGPVIRQIADYEGSLNAAQQPHTQIWADYGSPITYSKALRCSPNDGFWCTSHRRLTYNGSSGYFAQFTFGADTVTNIGSSDVYGNNPHNGGWGVDENGNDAFFYISIDGNDDFNNFTTYSKNQIMVRANMTYDLHTFIEADPTIDFEKDSIVYLGGGVHLTTIHAVWNAGLPVTFGDAGGVAIVTALPGIPAETTDPTNAVFMNELNPTYGWNGSAWVKGHAGSKAMHAAAEELIDGVTIAFDDASGVNNWQDTDFYTFIVYNGLVADGSTTFEQNVEVYVKPTLRDTSLEASVLPATTRVPGGLTEFSTPLLEDWQDAANVNITTDYIYHGLVNNYDTWDGGARTILPAILGSTSNLSSTTRLTDNDMTGIQGYVEFNFYANNNIDTYPYQHAAGLSNASHLGMALTGDTMMYSIRIDSGPTADGSGLVDMTVVESGVVKATINDVDLNGQSLSRARIIIKTDGSVVYEMHDAITGVVQLHVSPPGTATIEDLHFEYSSSSYDGGLKFMKFNYHVPSDHYLFFGNGVDTGLFSSKFRLVDGDKTNILIDGLVAAHVGINDTDTVLTTGQYSVFPEHGVLRYAAVDAGKTISGNYIYVSDEI